MPRSAGIRIGWLIASVLYMGVIFFVSSRPYLHAPGPEFDMKDKLAHATEYGILVLLIGRACGAAIARDRLVVALTLIATACLVAGADEVFQGTVPGRLTDPGDWLADVAGAALAAAMVARAVHRTGKVVRA